MHLGDAHLPSVAWAGRPGGWQDAAMSDETTPDEPVERFEVSRTIPADASAIFEVLRSPAGHVAIDSSGMLQDFTGEPASAEGDTFVIHMDRESLNDYPLGKYDVTVLITRYEQDTAIAWTPTGALNLDHEYGYELAPAEDGGTVVTQYYDWTNVDQEWKDGVFPVISEVALRATLGILDRTVRQGGVSG
jgi:hypothetical protein